MLIRFSINNFCTFSSEVELTLESDLRTKKFLSNVLQTPQGNVVKTLAIYGPNNTGKTSVLKAIRAYKTVLLNKHVIMLPNLFFESSVIKLGAVFLWKENRYRYSFKYDAKSSAFIEEDFAYIKIDQYGNERKERYFYRNTETKEFQSTDEGLKKIIGLSSKDNILINTLDASEFPLLQEAKDVLRGFAESISILSLQSLEPSKTINMLKEPKSAAAQQIVNLIKHADLDIDDFKYEERSIEGGSGEMDEDDAKSKGIQGNEKLSEWLKLTSTHRGKALPSIVFDSFGTKKIVSLAGYIVEALNSGGCLFVDELDSGIHFKLSRAIVSLFNSPLNTCAQLIFTTHDASLLDIKTLFRKEQLWFTYKDKAQTYLYSLSDFTAQNSGLRADSNLYEYYSKGLLGALPDPSLIDILIEKEGPHNG